jgi:hypothetical protein
MSIILKMRHHLPRLEGELRKLGDNGSKGRPWSDWGVGGKLDGVVNSCGRTLGEGGGGYMCGRNMFSVFIPAAKLAFSGFCFAWW